MAGSPIFVILAVASTAIFFLGVFANISFWLQGSETKRSVGAGFKSAPAGPLFLLRAIATGLTTALVWKSFFLDTLLQRRLWRLGRLRWLMQIGFIWGMAELFFVGSIGDMLAEKGILPITKDTPIFALSNEAGTVLILLGVGIALYRRFVAKEVALPTSAGDAVLVMLMATVVLSGIVLEAMRLVYNGTPPGVGWYSFVGYALAQIIRPLANLGGDIYAPLWWLHIVLAFSFVAYLPFSKLFHVVAAPVALAAAAVEK